MLFFLMNNKMLILVITLVIALGTTSMMYKLQKQKNYSQKIQIEQLEYQRDQYAATLAKSIEDQKRVDKAMLAMEEEHKKINDNVNHYEKVTNEVFQKESWDEERIPDNVVCLIHCVQQSKQPHDCPCANTDVEAKLLGGVRKANAAR